MKTSFLQLQIEKIQTRFRELSLSDPGELFSSDGRDFDHDKRARSIVGELTRDLRPEDRKRIEAEYFENGPLEPLVERHDVTEIIVNGPNAIWFESEGRLQLWPDRFLSEMTYRNFLLRLAREAGIQVSLECPFADGQWKEFRAHLTSPPAAGSGLLALRRHPTQPWRLQDLQERQWASGDALACLRQLIERRKNFLIVGGTGCGKTSVLNACLQELRHEERCVLIEDTSELHAPNSASTKLLTRHDPSGSLRTIDQTELLKQSLRMRPDRIVMGEIRGNEAKDLLMAFATGHAGCMGTLHAESARQALLRLEMLIQLGAAQWSLQAVRTLVLLSLHAIVVVQRTSSGQRKLEGIYRLASLEEVGFLLEKIA